MSRDLTDHVRERDEAEGEHKPVTNNEAENARHSIIQQMQEYEGSQRVPCDYIDFSMLGWQLRLLRDRAVAMEIIGAFAMLACRANDPVACDGLDHCMPCQARALIAAVKG